MTETPTLLLDLHYTFAIDEPWHKAGAGRTLSYRIPRENYRTWIIDLAKSVNALVVMTSARPERYWEATMERIAEACDGWQPDGAYFRQIEGVDPHVAKEDNLKRIIADLGSPTPVWIGFESNHRTRSMYKRYGIFSLPVHRLDEPLTAWPRNLAAEGVDPFDA